jgi:DNA-binding MarR family transcriptional regulator
MNAIGEVLTALRRVIRAADLHSKYLEKTAGLTAPQLLLLQILRDRGETTSGELARAMTLSQATVTTILDRLEKRLLVSRRRSQTDKRKVYTALTEAGEQAVRAAPTPLQHHFVRQFQDLHDWEQAMIIASLQRVAQMMDAQHLDAAPLLDVGALDRDSPEEAGPANPATARPPRPPRT